VDHVQQRCVSSIPEKTLIEVPPDGPTLKSASIPEQFPGFARIDPVTCRCVQTPALGIVVARLDGTRLTRSDVQRRVQARPLSRACSRNRRVDCERHGICQLMELSKEGVKRVKPSRCSLFSGIGLAASAIQANQVEAHRERPQTLHVPIYPVTPGLRIRRTSSPPPGKPAEE
jgi:hypothetical protein